MTVPIQNPYTSPGSAHQPGIGTQAVKDNVRVGMIITFALVQGVVFLTAIAIYLTMSSGEVAGADFTAANAQAMPAAGGDFVLPGIGLIACLGALVASFVIPVMINKTAVNKFRSQLSASDSGQSIGSDPNSSPHVAGLLGASMTGTIVGQAILEGAAVINAVLMIVDGHLIHVAAIGALIAGIVVQMPTQGKRLEMIQNAMPR